MINFLTIPKIFWFTGQAGAGKTELANMLKTRLIREQTIIQQIYATKKISNVYLPNKKLINFDRVYKTPFEINICMGDNDDYTPCDYVNEILLCEKRTNA